MHTKIARQLTLARVLELAKLLREFATRAAKKCIRLAGHI